MSSDNFWLIRRTPGSRYIPLMGFASDDEKPEIDMARVGVSYPTAKDALRSVIDDYAEYGHSIHPECELSERAWWTVLLARTGAPEPRESEITVLRERLLNPSGAIIDSMIDAWNEAEPGKRVRDRTSYYQTFLELWIAGVAEVIPGATLPRTWGPGR